MSLHRRRFLALAGAATVPAAWSPGTASQTGEGAMMFGLIGKMIAVPGERDALAAILLEGTAAMPGCLSYVIATDPGAPDALWITEVWDSADSHQASLALPAVQDAIARGRPLIAGFGERVETLPIGGHGLAGSGSQ